MSLILIASLALVSVIGVSLYDLRHKRIPNWITLPLLLLGLILHFPGSIEIWLGCVFLFIGWRFKVFGAGDAKLWMALLWLAPTESALTALLVMGLSMMLTALVQIAWRKYKQMQTTGVRSPAAWRALPYAAWLFLLAIGLPVSI